MKVYIVEMLRWGERSNHSYVAGVYKSLKEAEKAGMEEDRNRGGKYDYVITEKSLGC